MARTSTHEGPVGNHAAVAIPPRPKVPSRPPVAVYRTTALKGVLPQPPADAAARSLLAVAHTTVPVDEAESHDVDTPEALAAARTMALGE